ncbi:hypothetical protein ABZP36_018796 [Zizania latifolia]
MLNKLDVAPKGNWVTLERVVLKSSLTLSLYFKKYEFTVAKCQAEVQNEELQLNYSLFSCVINTSMELQAHKSRSGTWGDMEISAHMVTQAEFLHVIEQKEKITGKAQTTDKSMF